MTGPMRWIALALFAAAPGAGAPPPRVDEVLTASKTVVGEPLRYPEGGAPVVHAVVVTLRPGEATVRHRHGVPLFAYVLEGELSVEYAGHARRVYRRGEGLLEAMGTFHVGRNEGTSPVRILAVYMGVAGAPETVSDGDAPR